MRGDPAGGGTVGGGRRRPVADAGFTLLEVMVATLIMAIAVAALLTNLNNSLRNVERLSSYDRASTFAQHKMGELLANPRLGVLANVSGGYLPGEDAMQSGWRARVLPYEYPPGQNSAVSLLEQIHLEVWWTRNNVKKTYTLNGYRAASLTQEEMDKVRFLIRAGGILQ